MTHRLRLLVALVFVAVAGLGATCQSPIEAPAEVSPALPPLAGLDAPVDFEREVKPVLEARCVACHAAMPSRFGFVQPPKGVVLESAEQIGQHAAKIAETVGNRTMPIGNLTQMTDDERALVAAWFAQRAR